MFSRYSDFCVFAESTNFKTCDTIIDISAQQKLLSFFWILVSVKRKFCSDISDFYGKHFQLMCSSNEKTGNYFFLIVMPCTSRYHMYNFKNVKNTHGGVLLLVKLQALLKVALLHRCFPRFLNCANGTKSRKVSQMEN